MAILKKGLLERGQTRLAHYGASFTEVGAIGGLAPDVYHIPALHLKGQLAQWEMAAKTPYTD